LIGAVPLLAPSLVNAQGKDVVVFAAASLKNALDEVNAALERESGKKALISYAASPALAGRSVGEDGVSSSGMLPPYRVSRWK